MEIKIPENLPYKEEWKNLLVENFEHYQVSNYGRIRNSISGCIRKAKDNGGGYLTVTLKSHGEMKHVYVHREVARLFLSNFKEELQVNHIDKIKYHNYVSNLEMVTDSENKIGSNDEYVSGHIDAQGKWIYIYNTNGELVDSSFGIYKYCRDHGHDVSSVYKVLLGKYKTHHGLVFSYYSPEELTLKG